MQSIIQELQSLPAKLSASCWRCSWFSAPMRATIAGRKAGSLDRFAFIQAEKERVQLIDHIGACERIKGAPLASVFSIKIRRFLFLYLTVLPVAVVDKVGIWTPGL
ncbi:bestrophin family protein [Lignipirellula cremea]|uniref:bestrophin family ion channel n=1 Tax=Lignipirellula cremea TaxID=2528010 RepID=UPI003703D1BB